MYPCYAILTLTNAVSLEKKMKYRSKKEILVNLEMHFIMIYIIIIRTNTGLKTKSYLSRVSDVREQKYITRKECAVEIVCI